MAEAEEEERGGGAAGLLTNRRRSRDTFTFAGCRTGGDVALRYNPGGLASLATDAALWEMPEISVRAAQQWPLLRTVTRPHSPPQSFRGEAAVEVAPTSGCNVSRRGDRDGARNSQLFLTFLNSEPKGFHICGLRARARASESKLRGQTACPNECLECLIPGNSWAKPFVLTSVSDFLSEEIPRADDMSTRILIAGVLNAVGAGVTKRKVRLN